MGLSKSTLEAKRKRMEARKAKDRKNNFYTYIIVIVIGAFIFFKISYSVKEAFTPDECMFPESVEEVTNCIQGTWISTPIGELWNKVVFDNGMYRMYSASPSDGRWPNNASKIGRYSIKESRYMDTGKKYTVVYLYNSGICKYQITFDNGVPYLYCGRNPSIIKKSDKAPWN